MAYQDASDAVPGMNPYSGVIRDDGRWVACAANSDLWDEYLTWAETETNKRLPFKSPADGGYVIKLQEGEEAYGSMLDSLPPEGETVTPGPMQPPPPPPAGAMPPPPSGPVPPAPGPHTPPPHPEGHTTTRTTTTTRSRPE